MAWSSQDVSSHSPRTGQVRGPRLTAQGAGAGRHLAVLEPILTHRPGEGNTFLQLLRPNSVNPSLPFSLFSNPKFTLPRDRSSVFIADRLLVSCANVYCPDSASSWPGSSAASRTFVSPGLWLGLAPGPSLSDHTFHVSSLQQTRV